MGVAMNILRSWTPRREDGAFCVRHGQHCPAFPARGASTPEPLHLEIDGINCQPWTTAGKKLGCIPCLILMRTILCMKPGARCLECTPKFDFAIGPPFLFAPLLPVVPSCHAGRFWALSGPKGVPFRWPLDQLHEEVRH